MTFVLIHWKSILYSVENKGCGNVPVACETQVEWPRLCREIVAVPEFSDNWNTNSIFPDCGKRKGIFVSWFPPISALTDQQLYPMLPPLKPWPSNKNVTVCPASSSLYTIVPKTVPPPLFSGITVDNNSSITGLSFISNIDTEYIWLADTKPLSSSHKILIFNAMEFNSKFNWTPSFRSISVEKYPAKFFVDCTVAIENVSSPEPPITVKTKMLSSPSNAEIGPPFTRLYAGLFSFIVRVPESDTRRGFSLKLSTAISNVHKLNFVPGPSSFTCTVKCTIFGEAKLS